MRAFNNNGSFGASSGGNNSSAGGNNNAQPVNHHVFTSVLAHSGGSGSNARGPRHFDVLARRNAAGQQQQSGGVSKDQACADHQLQAIVRLKGANILRQRLIFLLRQKFAKEFAQLAAFQQLQQLHPSAAATVATTPAAAQPSAAAAVTTTTTTTTAAVEDSPGSASVDVPTTAAPSTTATPSTSNTATATATAATLQPHTAPPKSSEPTPLQQALVAIEEMIISVDNTDVVNAGYLRDFAKTQHHHQPHQHLRRESGGNVGTTRNQQQVADQSQSGKPNRLVSPTASRANNNSAHAGNCQCVCPSCGVKKIQRSASLGGVSSSAFIAPALSSDRMLSLGTPSFILQSSSSAFGGVPLATESRFGIAGPSATSQTPSEVSSSAVEDDSSDDDDINDEDDDDAGDDRAAAALMPDTVNDAERLAEIRKREEADAAEAAAAGMSGLRSGAFYEMRVKRVLGSGTVCCPKCLCNLAEVPAIPIVVCSDASTNTAERSESEKDYMLVSLSKAKVDTEKKLEDMKKELQAFKKAKYASQNLATPTPAPATAAHASPQIRPSQQREDPGPLPLQDNVAMGTMSPTRASTPGVGGTDDFVGNSSFSNTGGTTTSTAARASTSHSQQSVRGSPSGRHGSSSVGASPASRAGGSRVNSRRPQAAVDMSSEGLFGSPSNNNNSTATFEGPTSSPGSTTTQQQQRIHLALRVTSSIRDMRTKLNALRAGIRSFQFKEVIGQFSQHVIPQLQQVQATNKRLLDRDYILEKLLLDALCKVGTMPDSGSPEGYLPEGGPLHVGTYSLLDDRRFLEWTRRISETLSGKVTAVQSYIQALSNELKFQQPNGGGGKRSGDGGSSSSSSSAAVLEERIVGLEGSLVENECFNVSNILDHTFDSSTAVQGTRRTELVTLLKHAAETNEEIRLIYVVPSWATKPQLRVKLNMWRQRRLEALQKVEQLLNQELQHFVSSGAQKIMLKGKLMTIRELIQLASRLHLMPSTGPGTTISSSSAAAAGGGGGKNAVAAAAALSAASTAVGTRATSPPSVGNRARPSLASPPFSAPNSSHQPPPSAAVTSPKSALMGSSFEGGTGGGSVSPSSLSASVASAQLLPPSLTNVGMLPAGGGNITTTDDSFIASPLSASPSGSGSTMHPIGTSSRRLEALPMSSGTSLLATSPPSSAERGGGGGGGGGGGVSASSAVGSPIGRRAVSGGSKLPPVK